MSAETEVHLSEVEDINLEDILTKMTNGDHTVKSLISLMEVFSKFEICGIYFAQR